MTMKDYYEVLGLTTEAPTEEIRIAYRKLAKANHPDKHKGDPAYVEKFKDIQEAYDMLKSRLLIKKRINLLTITHNNSHKQNNPNNLAPRKLKIYIPWWICISKNEILPYKHARNTIVFSLLLAKNISIG